MRIFIGERDKHAHKPLYEWIVIKAREFGVAGATVLRGMMGFGAKSRIKTSKILRLSEDLPIVIELVDTEEKLHKFLTTIDHAIKNQNSKSQTKNIRIESVWNLEFVIYL